MPGANATMIGSRYYALFLQQLNGFQLNGRLITRDS
jgi:hypothetical protein